MNNLLKKGAIGLMITATLTMGAVQIYAQTTSSSSASPGAKAIQKEANQQTRITNAKQRADNEIVRRVTSLNALIARINAMKKLSVTSKSTLTTNIQTQITNLNTLKTKIDADTDITTLQTDIKSILDSFRIYALFIPETHLLASADVLLQATDTYASYITMLQTKIQLAQSAGKDVTSLTAALTDMQSKIADAKTQANSAISTITPLQPGPDPSVYKPVLQSAQKMLQASRADLQAARNDAKTIIQGLRALGGTKTSSSSATTK